MVSAAVTSIVILKSGFSIPELFLFIAALNAAVAIYIFSLLPEFLMRFLAWLAINVVYRIRPAGLENIPAKGPAVVVCNHVSFMDPIILGGSIARPMRFVMYYKIFQIPVLSFIFKTANAIPIAGGKEDPELMRKAFDRVSDALNDDEVVCIFPEGKITDDGEMNEFKAGVSRVLKRDPVPVVPLALRGLWGSFFSRKYGNAMNRLAPRGLFSRIDLVAGDPIAASEASLRRLSDSVIELRGEKR